MLSRTASKSSREPPKRRRSVRTLTTLAPALSYTLANAAGSAIVASAPLLGDERFTSAIIDNPSELKAFMTSLAGDADSTIS
ncbi:unannotated protein [freshwater metagenome]|uniref:Unannotated protein n=1 Tax=freshwater metagenome TaxID=449393 RepID=A0A6J7I0F2_9ZZZZ